jgi:hypothetical protein
MTVKHDPEAGTTTTTKLRGLNGTAFAALSKAFNQTVKQAILGVHDVKEVEEREGIVDGVVWEVSPARIRREQDEAAKTMLADSVADQDLDAKLAA